MGIDEFLRIRLLEPTEPYEAIVISFTDINTDEIINYPIPLEQAYDIGKRLMELASKENERRSKE